MSEIYTIENEHLALSVSAKGAEMQSLKLDGRELLWQGDARYWPDRAPNLFPYIARLTNGAYTHNGKPFRLDIHGFVKDSRLAAVQQSHRSLVFELVSNTETLAQYPFAFVYRVAYVLQGSRVTVQYQVENSGDEAMYFGIGGHPGFALPLEAGLDFSDYFLEFSEPCRPVRILFSEENFVTGEEPFVLQKHHRLPLAHALFNDDAIVLEKTPGSVQLKSDKGNACIQMDYADFRYLGLWHAPRTKAPYLCIEPWSSLPARQGVVEELTCQPSLLSLAAGGKHCSKWTIEVK